jgi:hypothetical protein
MKTEFVIYKGSISFPGNQIMIRDDSNKWTRWLSTASSVATIIIGAYMTGRSLVVSPGEISWIGLATIAVGLLAILIGTRISTDGELDAGQVEKAVISHDFAGYLNVTFHLSNSRKRKAVLDYNDEDKFEKFYLKEFIETLNGRAIRTEIR